MRDLILERAQEQMRRGGYGALNFAWIAENLSTTRANVHHHFGSKRGLAMEATKAYIELNLSFVEQIAAEAKGDLPRYLARIEAMMLAAILERGEQSRCICGHLVREADVPEALQGMARDFHERKFEIMTGVAADSQAAGRIRREVAPEQLAAMATALLLGIGQMAESVIDAERFLRETEGLMLAWIEPYRLRP